MKRRDALKQLSLASLALSVSPISRGQGATVPAGGYSLVIDLNGERLEFLESTGQDLGNYNGPGFVQRCVRATRPNSALTVYFRPDEGSDRMEVVVELGRMWGPENTAAAHLGAYRATIKKGDVTLDTVDVPQHWWFSRWRWQSSPRPVVNGVKSLIETKLLPPYSAEMITAPKPPTVYPAYSGPMDNAGLNVDLAAQGERYEIGPVTEYQAQYLVEEDRRSLASLLAQAEAAASMPMHLRDEHTGAPVDFFKYPKIDWYYTPSGGVPWVKRTPTSGVGLNDLKCPWQLNSAHDPAIAYVPYLLTGDPYYLEELQFQATQNVGWTAYDRSETGLQIVYPGETRSYAWSMRTLFQLARVTPTSVPRWLQPRDYWKHIVDDNLKWFSKSYVAQTSAACSLFNAATRLDHVGAWQEEFLALILGWAVYMGFEEWRPAFLWKLGSTLARTNGKSGWNRNWCTPYYFTIGKNLPVPTIYASKINSAAWFTNWSEAWQAYIQDLVVKKAVPDENIDSGLWQQPNYLIYTRGVLALATHLGVEEAKESYDFVNQMTGQKAFIDYRWSIAAM